MQDSRLTAIEHLAKSRMTRRYLLGRTAGCLGAAAFGALTGDSSASAAGGASSRTLRSQGISGLPHFAPTAKRVIYLFQSGGPSHIDLFDYHPRLRQLHGTELPDSVRNGQRITGMTSIQTSFPVVAPMFNFAALRSTGHVGERPVAAHVENRR